MSVMNFLPGEIGTAAAPFSRRDDMVQALGLWGLDRLDLV
jgi:hypothetical protein